ncbi:hypothetical protein I5Q39_02230 [Serratia marcescens]|nr:hypothetical protein [Serratia marcescens]
MNNKLSALSKPVFEIEISDGYWLNCSISPLQPRDGAKFNGWPDGVNRLYSQEYVSALLEEIGVRERSLISNCVDYEYDLIEMKRRAEAAEQRVSELEQAMKEQSNG